jgi:hypothetical protein
VLWVGPEQWAQAGPLRSARNGAAAIYLSASLSGAAAAVTQLPGGAPVRLAYPLDLPVAREARLAVVRQWMRNNNITPSDEIVQMNAYLAATVTGMVVSHSEDTYSREYLLERMEHRLGTAFELSLYPHLSLGPGQRFASKGAYVVSAGEPGHAVITPLSNWIVP